MNKKIKLIITFFVVAIIFVGFYLLLFKVPETTTKYDNGHTQPILKEQSESPHEIDKIKKTENLSEKETKEFMDIINDENKSKRQKKWEIIRKAIKATKVPIEFYGKVVDQNNMPVSEAIVNISIGSHDGTVFKKLITGTDGIFELTNGKGKYLYIDNPKRDGYEAPKRARYTFNYGGHMSKHIPDFYNPTIFKMWKKGETEPLIKSSKTYKIKSDGSAYYINLLNKRGSSKDNNDFDLIVEMKVDNDIGSKRYNWSIAFKTINGGLIETEDAFLYKAPENGYQESFELKLDKNEPMWSEAISRKFYLKSREGNVYAALNCRIISDNNSDGHIKIKSIINPNGSRNLEYDPEKVIFK